jgi:hypothetical protein
MKKLITFIKKLFNKSSAFWDEVKTTNYADTERVKAAKALDKLTSRLEKDKAMMEAAQAHAQEVIVSHTQMIQEAQNRASVLEDHLVQVKTVSNTIGFLSKQ